MQKSDLILKNPIVLEESSGNTIIIFTYFKLSQCVYSEYAWWIDVCPTNSNLLAAGCTKTIKIYDKRTSGIVKTFDSIHSGNKLTNFVLQEKFLTPKQHLITVKINELI